MKISDYAQKRYIILNKIVKYSKIKTKFPINYICLFDYLFISP